MTDAVPAPLAPQSLRLVFGALMLVLLLASLDQTIVSTALPTIAGELGGLAHLSWIVTAYLLATTVVTPIYGKLGDLYGRKVVLQAAIALFLAGSALCGLSETMGELIAFRAIQGLGGGGLMVTAMAAVGDVVSPRERGRYQGLFGAVFGLSTVVGPLIGGFFVAHLSWRWIFYVNLPLGLLAFLALAWAFPVRRVPGRRAVIDYPGAGLLAAALTGLVLFTSLAGTVLPWGSAAIVGLGVLTLASVAAFVFVELRSEEPILPPALFRNRVFAISGAVGFIVGLAIFGSVTYLPLYLQVVKGMDPSTAGLAITPMMGGVLLSSITSGRIISRVGRYKIFPLVGTAVMTGGLLLLSTLDVATPVLFASGYMLLLGLGLGMVMQVLVLAVQNAVPYEVLGVATAGTTLFRSIGGAVGVSLFGALFAGGLAGRVAGLGDVPAFADPAALLTLPEAVRGPYLAAFAAALRPVFLTATVLAAIAFGLTFLLEELPLRKTTRSEDIGGSFAVPRDPTSIEELERIVTRLADARNRWAVYERLAQELGVTLAPDAMWLLGRLAEGNPTALAGRGRRVRHTLEALAAAGYIASASDPVLTPAGLALHERLVERRRAGMSRLIEAWEPEGRAEVQAMLAKLARLFIAEPPVPAR